MNSFVKQKKERYKFKKWVRFIIQKFYLKGISGKRNSTHSLISSQKRKFMYILYMVEAVLDTLFHFNCKVSETLLYSFVTYSRKYLQRKHLTIWRIQVLFLIIKGSYNDPKKFKFRLNKSILLKVYYC